MIELDLFDAHPIIGESEEKIELDVVLSVFDGMSCGQMALKRAGLTPRVYYASEIEKSPMDITKKNFPSTIMLGDVRKVKGEDLPHVNLLLGGSPCQGFSFAGKQLNFDHPQSKLFFEFVRDLNPCKRQTRTRGKRYSTSDDKFSGLFGSKSQTSLLVGKKSRR